MTPSKESLDKARESVRELVIFWDYMSTNLPCVGSPQAVGNLYEAIAAALDSARDQALEEAAKIAEEPRDETLSVKAFRIRALKSKGTE